MAAVKAIHLNPPGASGKTRCGRKLATVQHREDEKDVTCDMCKWLAANDRRRA